MRTTLDIDSDILELAKELGRKEKRTAGAVLSSLARAGYQAESKAASPADGALRNGIEMLPKRDAVVTLSHVQSLMDEEGI